MGKRKIAYVSGTRADYGLMTPILRAVANSFKLDLQLYVTGIHLMPKFGETAIFVEKEFPSTKRIKSIFKTDERFSMVGFSGEYINLLNKIFQKNRPDMVLILGDRIEMLCTAMVCLYLGIPTAHIHGGEKTYAVDEVTRHAITKISSLHFPATKESAERIIKMGEEKWRVHVVGAPALDIILNKKLPTKKDIFKTIGLDPKQQFILITQHPVSEEIAIAAQQMRETLEAAKSFNMPIIITYPHSDPGGRRIIEVIEKYKNNPLFHIFPSIKYESFLALEREAAVWIGNSSGAMIESSSFKTPVVNIGTRQIGRQRGKNVIDVSYNREEIVKAIKKSLTDKSYLAKLQTIKNLWGDGKTGPRVARILEEVEINSKLLTKQITY
ncbi:MAG: UDP-N-acetylglucosamine 2-epimerase [Candidatus Daviesbacteria bacterium]|nr:UDP-N-acetylglucosamine 2-epimerase [Candidatus Daviesbacteria bacterium]